MASGHELTTAVTELMPASPKLTTARGWSRVSGSDLMTPCSRSRATVSVLGTGDGISKETHGRVVVRDGQLMEVGNDSKASLDRLKQIGSEPTGLHCAISTADVRVVTGGEKAGKGSSTFSVK